MEGHVAFLLGMSISVELTEIDEDRQNGLILLNFHEIIDFHEGTSRLARVCSRRGQRCMSLSLQAPQPRSEKCG